MGDLPGVIQTVFGLVAIITAGVAAILLTSVRTLRQSIGDRDSRITGLEGRVGDLESQLETEKVAHETTRRDMDALARVVTGEAHWKAIELRLDDVATAFREFTGEIKAWRQEETKPG
jgi:hypothetical protein